MMNKKLNLWFIYRNNNLLLIKNNNDIKIPTTMEIESLHGDLVGVYNIGLLNGISCFCGELPSSINIPENFILIPLSETATLFTNDTFSMCGKAYQINYWNQTHKFCGKCGSKTTDSKSEFAKICTNCGFISYPRISPAIIVGITKGDKMLLAHNKNFPNDVHSTIAGFLDPNETLEHCIRREVLEEVGIKIKNIKYFDSQPWPYPNSIMIGFTAEYDSGEISVDGKEITHADWYDRNNLPNLPAETTIARRIINKLLSLQNITD